MRNLRILVVEDEWLIAEELKDQIEQLGQEVLGPAFSCAEALEILRQERPDQATVDTHLGSETCEAVLNELSAQSVSVLICSGHTQGGFLSFPVKAASITTPPFAVASLSLCRTFLA